MGKTTITANLGATLAREGLRVLLLDLDHQSSLSIQCLTPHEIDEVRRSRRYTKVERVLPLEKNTIGVSVG